MLDTIDPNLFGISLTRKQKQLKRKVRQQFRQQMINEVLQSRRCYRNIYYPMYYDFALQAMSTHRLQQLQTVELLLDNECFSSLDIWITFANAIPLMEQLHTLYLKSYASSFVYPYNVAPIVRSNSLRHLTVDKVFPVTADMPALATYEGPLSALHRLGPNMPRNQFEMMHKLSITDSEYSNKWMANDYREFFRRLPNIQTIKYMCDESGNGFTTAMSEASNTLQELVCGTRDISSFHLLSNLTSLRRLELYSDNWSSAPVTGSYDLSKLTKLEELDLGNLSVKRSFIQNLPNSITNLKLLITHQSERSLMRAITSSMPLLKELRIELKYFNQPNYAPMVTLRFLPLLKRLEKFECSGGFFGESCLLDMNTPMYRLRKLRFNSCQLDSKHLKGLHEKLPKLKELEFENCRLKSGDRLDNECQRF